MSSTLHYAVKDRDGKINQEPGKKAAKRDQKEYGGLIVRSKGEGEYKPWKPHHVFLWVFLGIQVIAIIWIITAISSGTGASSAEIQQWCGNGAWQGVFTSYADCVKHGAVGIQAAHDVGKGLAVGVLVIGWVIVDFLLGLTYGIYRLVKR